MNKKSTPSNLPQPDRVLDLDLDGSIGFLISDTARHVKRLLYGPIAQHGIRGGSWFVLRALWEADGVTQRELANRLGMTQPSTLEILRVMEREGLVRFERDTVDRRKLRIYITEYANTIKTPLLRIATEANSVLLGRLSQAEELLLKVMLRTVRSSAADAIAQFELNATAKKQPEALNLRDEAREGGERKRVAVKGVPRTPEPRKPTANRKRKA